MSNSIPEQLNLCTRFDKAEKRGWHLQQDANRVRAFYPQEYAERFGFKSGASSLVSDNLSGALDWIDGFEAAMFLKKVEEA